MAADGFMAAIFWVRETSERVVTPVLSHLPRGDGGHGGVLVAVPHPVVVGDLPRRDERNAIISQQPLVI